MSKDNLAACLPTIFANEGGMSRDRNDKGNWTGGEVGVGRLVGTNMGIAAASHPGVDIAGLTKAQAAKIYDDDYWMPAGCEALPAGLDLVHLDGTVNSGPARARKWLASASGGAVAARIHAYSSARLSFDQALSSWRRYGKAWGTRVASVEAKGLKMALAANGTSPEAASAVIVAAAKGHAKTAAIAASTSRASTAIAGGAIAAATLHPAAGGAVGLASIVVAAWSAFTAWRAATRAAALTHAA